MAKLTNRNKILTEGLRVVHERGFQGASVRDIVQAAGVPQGSFTNHFASKEAFGLEVLDLYFAESRAKISETLLNEDLAPLARLRAYLSASRAFLCQCDMRNGCLLGNFSAETTDQSEVLRHRLAEIFAELRASFATCLTAAVAAGEVAEDLDCAVVAGFLLSSLQGAILLAKAERSILPMERFEQVLFSLVLRADTEKGTQIMVERRIRIPGPDHPITIEANPARVVVSLGGRVIADTRAALTLREAKYPAVQYIPRKDVDMTLLQRTDHVSYCPYKGDSAYFSILLGGERSANAVWTYEAPYEAVSAIRDHLAFYPDRVDSIE